jgi:uridine kinase
VTRDVLLDHLAGTIASTTTRPLLVGIDGVDASGKTTLANQLADLLSGRPADASVIRSSIDGFHHPRVRRHRRGRESAVGYYLDTFDYDAVRTELLEPLSDSGGRKYRVGTFDLAADAPTDSAAIDVPEHVVLIADGVFLQRPELRRFWTLVVFLHCSFDEVIRRARVRDLANFQDGDHLERTYKGRYIPGQQIYIDQCAPAINADIVIDNTRLNAPSLIRTDEERAAIHAAALAFRP